MAPQLVYGEIPGYPEGSEFVNRAALAAAGVHRPLQGGISGGRDGADSIVVSGGYPDDEDYGDEIVCTGQGGRDSEAGRQTADQKFVLGNAGLVHPSLLRSDTGPQPACAAMQEWARASVGSQFIPPGEPWRHHYVDYLYDLRK
jgi:hypothetical protein